VRAVLWSVGGLAGFGLLGVSVWIAVSAHQAPAPGAAPPRVADVAPSAPLDPLPGRPGAGPGGGTTPADSAPAPAATPSAAATPGNATIVAATAKPTAATPPLPSPINAPKTRAAAPAPRTAKTPVRAAAPAPEQARAKTPSTSSTPPPVTRGAENDRDDMWPTDAAVAPPPAAAPAPVAPTPRVEPGDAVAAPPPPSASTPPAHEPPTTPTTSSSSPAPDPKIPGTMQRLHEATEQAAAAADIDGLRRLRDAWRDYARSVVGPNRSLAKREYADCLWAVQLLTGRTDDQRDAAHAYRDFLLSAPAGGTDSRSAVRLRQLEDVLAERR